ncbi:type II toxin-antitoxin system HipA family toxin [Litchfieldella xinjiangensis]|uniref:type II toxin-antitoxin system HipA family toxin n=1 Tax=Litchfieldella xinjiangensis TaxID=1166948 RepID=UPI0005BA04F4|nr:type II toxin-antitoxin system HipA family toxin [Halomonas xinjiangensis]
MTTDSPTALGVWQGSSRVGTLWRGSDERLIGFEYDSDWQAQGRPISHSLPLTRKAWEPETLTAHHWFGNLLPEEQARDALIKRLGLPDDDFTLLAAIGGDCAGALSILPLDERPAKPEHTSAAAAYRELDAGRLSHWAAFKDRYAIMADELPDTRPRLSLAGAQDKIPVFLDQDRVYIPTSQAPSTHILKFAVAGREQVILNELYLNTLARLTGLPCPPCRIGYAERHPYLIVERYDRRGIGSTQIERIHQEDLCQAQGIPRSRKYQAFGGPDFGTIVQTVRDACKPAARSIQQLLHWQLFNVLAGNSDGHAKNISLVQDERGRWQIAPAYDLVGTIVLGYHPDLAFSIGQQYNSIQLLPRDWQAFSKACRFSYPYVKRQIKYIAGTLAEAARSSTLKAALQEAGLSDKGWGRLQQQRQHIQRQCRRAERW